MKVIPVLVAATIGVAPLADAQQASTDPRHVAAQPQFVVKTVPLHHLTSREAVKLLEPYSRTAGGGVYELTPNIRAVTIREMPIIFSEMMTVLSQYDREPATVTLSFQLIAAENTASRDPVVANLDSLLRGVLKFSGYRLLSTSVASASEFGLIRQTLSAGDEQLSLTVEVSDLRVDGNNASVHLNVSLTKPAIAATAQTPGQNPSQVLSTGVTVPIGQTVLLGTSTTEGGQRALILTVRPQLAKR